MPLAYHKDVPTELYVPIALAALGGVTLLLYRRVREPPRGVDRSRPNWAATAAIALGLVAAAAYGLAWVVPTEAESGIRRTIGDVCLVVTLAYALAVGPVLGAVGLNLVISRGQKVRATIGFLVGYVGLAWALGGTVACLVSDGCFH